MKLCRHDSIARFISTHEGRPCSPRTVQRYIAKQDHPLPVRRSGAVDTIESEQLVAWLEEESHLTAARRARPRKLATAGDR